MPQIKPEGFLEGERLRCLSAGALDKWPRFYAAANGYGRFPLDYKHILVTVFRHYPKTPSEPEVFEWLREYKDNYLLFVYKAEDGSLWGAFDSRSGQRYFNAADKRSPAPPEPAFTNWLKAYEMQKSKAARGRGKSVLHGLLGDIDDQAQLRFDVENPNLDAQNGNLDVEFSSSVRSLDVEPPQHKHKDSTQHVVLTQHNSKNTTQLNSEKQAALVDDSPPEPRPQAVAKLDEGWCLFRAKADSVGMGASDEEWWHLQTVVWPRMSIERQLAAIKGIEVRRHGEYREPAYVPLAEKYLTKGLWTRPLRPVPKPQGNAADWNEKGSRDFERRMMKKLNNAGGG